MRIMFVGDINLGEYYTSFGHGPGSYLEHSDVFENVRDLFSQADFVVGNLEAPLTTHNFNPTEPESVVLRGDPKHAATLRNAGFRVLQVANNHTVQHGKEGFSETLEALARAGITAIGVNGQKTQTIELEGETLGFLAASDVPDNTDKTQNCYQRLDDALVLRAKEAVSEVDHLFVLLHWGLESSTQTMDYQKSVIDKLCSIGVRGVIGSHPHLFYEIWKQQKAVVAPSLGNFVFDLFWDSRLLKSGILDIELEKQSISACRVWPVTISENGGRPILTGASQDLVNSLKLYDLGQNMSGEQTRKLTKFLKDFWKGNRKLKSQFILKKIVGKI
ncbi:CapA family protein [Marinobacter sp.]|uniref:CapA family protein n=1 Tax=Marinobacter sp. TaxID=50741 RepID=UPI003A8F5E7B